MGIKQNMKQLPNLKTDLLEAVREDNQGLRKRNELLVQKYLDLQAKCDRYEEALGKIKNSIETIIRVDGLTKEMDSAITQEIFHVKDLAKTALEGK